MEMMRVASICRQSTVAAHRHGSFQAAAAAAAASCSPSMHVELFGTRSAAAPQASAKDPADIVLRKAFAHCVRSVRESDYENYVWAAQLPKEMRPAVFALRAFNTEVASIADQVKQTMLVPMRMQWWRDAVNGLYKGKPIRHPAIQCLHQVNQAQPLTRYRLQKMITARETDLIEPDQPASISQLEQYADDTASQLLHLQLEAVGLHTREAEIPVSHLGKAVGITALLKGTAHHAQKQRIYLPKDACYREGVALGDVLAGRSSEQLRNVVFEVASAAKGHLDDARAAAEQLPVAARLLMLSSVGTGLYLNALEKADFDVFSPKLAKAHIGAA